MTTKVLIVNHGPDHVDVFTLPLTGSPPNIEALKVAADAGVSLAPTQSCEQYVHTHQSLYVRERPRQSAVPQGEDHG